jgi:hypothetical protein
MHLILPNRFWKKLSVQSPVYPKRLWGWVGISVLALYLLAAMLSIGLNAYITFRYNQFATDALNQGLIQPSFAAQYKTDMSQLSYWSELVLDQALMPLKDFVSGNDSASQIALILAGMILLWTLVLSVIPVTRRRAKLRMAHVQRSITLSVLMVIIVFMLTVITGAINEVLRYAGHTVAGSWGNTYSLAQTRFVQSDYYARWVVTVLFVATLIWIQWFWIAAIRRGWQIRSFMLPILGLIASLLAGYVVFMYLSQY